MNLLRSLMRPTQTRSWFPLETVTFNGNTYPLYMPQQTLGQKEEQIGSDYVSLATLAMKANPIVFACMDYRRRTFSQARFQWERLRFGTEGEFFGTQELAILERPSPSMTTTADLLARIIQDADLAGNAFVVRRSDRLKVLRPDWVTIVAGSDQEAEQGMAAIDAEVVGYLYWPGGKGMGTDPVALLPSEVAHFKPTPDPVAGFRGWSWVNVAIREIMGDQAATTHKLKFFENGGTPNMVVSLDPAITLERFNAWIEKFDQKHAGLANAYRTMYLGGGADVKVVGSDLKQIDFKVTQGAGETRIAAAAGVPPVLVGLSEGLASATYSNYASARRSYSDTTLWDLWGNVAGSLQNIVPAPPGSRLWVDGRRIPFLQEDEKDRAEIQQMDASAINSLITAGYDPVSVVNAVTSGDLKRLQHSGLYSVQLQAPGSEQGPGEQSLEDQIEDARAALEAKGIVKPTQAQLAEELGISERTLRRWQTGR